MESILQVIGLIFTGVGLVLIFYYGISPHFAEKGALFLSIDEDEQLNSKGYKNQALRKKYAFWGLYISLLGILMQLMPALLSIVIAFLC